jgi:hypothetical protein
MMQFKENVCYLAFKKTLGPQEEELLQDILSGGGSGNYRLRPENCRYDLDMEGFWSRDKCRIIAVIIPL